MPTPDASEFTAKVKYSTSQSIVDQNKRNYFNQIYVSPFSGIRLPNFLPSIQKSIQQAITNNIVPPVPSTSDILTFVRALSTTFSGTTVAPTAGDALTINSQSVGTYDYTVSGTTTVSSFSASNWFTSTKDTASAWIVVNGNLTINSGQTFAPAVRKLFTVLYVSGNLICNGSISMTGRGANHSGTGDSGGATTAVAIRIGTGTFGATTNPQIPATGGAGATGTTIDNGISSGTAGTNGGSGGGGAGAKFGGTRSGAGAAGTCFSGGSGGGGTSSGTAGSAEANGGKGGNGSGGATAGGTGNPGGDSGGINGLVGGTGTGGTLIVIVEGTLSGTGTIVSAGIDGVRPPGAMAGGASGGGSVTVLYGTDSSSITPTAAGGSGQFSGDGGAGTARKLAIGAN